MIPDWHKDRYCATNDNPDFWTEEDLVGYGKHRCLYHCPVQVECHTSQLERPQPGMYAGVWWGPADKRRSNSKIIPLPIQPKELTCKAHIAERETVDATVG